MTLGGRSRTAWLTVGLVSACSATEPSADTDGEGSTAATTAQAPSTSTATPSTPAGTTTAADGSSTDGATSGAPTDGGDDTTGGIPDTASCCEVHNRSRCDQPDVTACVCQSQAVCCVFDWDQTCVDLAEGKCAARCDDSGTGAPDVACDRLITFEIEPLDATPSGAWEHGMSGIGEGDIVRIPLGSDETDGSILWDVDIPCADTWFIWARALNNNDEDSYFARVDGDPMAPEQAIFEGDCSSRTVTEYQWTRLNWRDPDAPACTYVEDPWAPRWSTGGHQVEFTYRESSAMGRMLFTNDPKLVPSP